MLWVNRFIEKICKTAKDKNKHVLNGIDTDAYSVLPRTNELCMQMYANQIRHKTYK